MISTGIIALYVGVFLFDWGIFALGSVNGRDVKWWQWALAATPILNLAVCLVMILYFVGVVIHTAFQVTRE